jgi:hypothetical protein
MTNAIDATKLNSAQIENLALKNGGYVAVTNYTLQTLAGTRVCAKTTEQTAEGELITCWSVNRKTKEIEQKRSILFVTGGQI